MAGYLMFCLWSLMVTLNLDTERNVLNEIWVTSSQLEKLVCVEIMTSKDSVTFMANVLKFALRSLTVRVFLTWNEMSFTKYMCLTWSLPGKLIRATTINSTRSFPKYQPLHQVIFHGVWSDISQSNAKYNRAQSTSMDDFLKSSSYKVIFRKFSQVPFVKLTFTI